MFVACSKLATKEEIYDIMKPFGVIERLDAPLNKDNKRKNYVFVYISNATPELSSFIDSHVPHMCLHNERVKFEW